MKSLSLEAFYSKIKKSILLLEGYLEDKRLGRIIRACRLRPFEKTSSQTTLYRKWIDEFGNSFTINNSKKIIIIPNDLSITNYPITDLYRGLTIEKIILISQKAYICSSKGECKDMYFIALLGIDNYLRCFVLIDDEWENVSPLLLGMTHLNNIFDNIDLRLFKKFSFKEKKPFPCAGGEAWLTSLPASQMFWQTIKNDHEIIFNLLKGATQ